MSNLRLYSVYDLAVSVYLRPFWSDHKENAIRAFRQLVNDHSNPDNNVAVYPHQFVLFELGEFDPRTGVFSSHHSPLSLGGGHEYVKSTSASNSTTEDIRRLAS